MRPNLSGLSDRDLVLRVQDAHDRDAFGELVRRHHTPLRAFLWRLTGNGGEAEDLAQDVFIRCYDRIAGFRGASSFRTWVFAIAYREFLRWKRRGLIYGKLLRHFSRAPEGGDALHPDEAFELQRSLNALGVTERAALLLCDACGLSHSEAAEALSVPLGSLKTYVQRGREKMRARLGDHAELEQGQLVSCKTTI
ncbi:MAG TPA: RNA polymerase sigma factor [Rhizomicrobium sp.]|nr:RNA polymerase sigma factor [Rhizomicrobium sp.]